MDFFKALNRFGSILKSFIGIVLGIIDVLVVALAFQLSYSINYSYIGGFFFQDSTILYLYLVLTTFWMVILYLLKISEIPRAKRYRILFFEYLNSALIVSLLMILIYFAFKLSETSRLFLVMIPVFGFISLFLVRLLEYKVLRVYRSRGYNLVNVVIIADDNSEYFIDTLIDQKEWGYKIVAIFSDSERVREKYQENIIYLEQKNILVLNDLIEGDIVDEVLYLKTKVNSVEIRQTMRSCEELGVVFRLLYHNGMSHISSSVETMIYNYKFLTFINIPHNNFALTIKNIFDVSASLVLLLILSPILLGISIAVKLSSKGPVMFRQHRVGLRGRQFTLYKFRTMVDNAEGMLDDLKSRNEADGPAFKIKDDPRITPLGSFLRRSGLDELPQIFNILKGEMSFIGPRPPLPNEIKQYRRWQLRRLSVKPGLSCFWQVQPNRHNIKFDKWMELDLAYIDNWSLRLDMIIFFKTVMTILRRTGE